MRGGGIRFSKSPENVIPGRCGASNPESRDSGAGPSDHPGMTGTAPRSRRVFFARGLPETTFVRPAQQRPWPARSGDRIQENRRTSCAGGMLYARKQRLVAVETAVRFVPSEPLEYCAVKVGEPLETQGQLPRRVDRRRRPGRCVAAKISVGWPRGRVAVGVGGRSQNRIGWASKTNGGGWGPVRPASRSPFPLDFSLDPRQVGFDREGGV
jgi:hypothetical protein